MSQTLETRRSEAEAKLTELRVRRGAATLDNKSFDPAGIAALENEIEALDEAGGEQARRSREEAERAYAKHLAGLRKSLKVMESRRLGAIQDANMAARTLAESIGQVLDTTRKMAKLAHEISGGPVPVQLRVPDIVTRLCGRLSAVMGTVSGYRNRFGSIEWKNASLYRSSDNWRDCEAKILEGHLRPLIEKEKGNDKQS